MATHKKATEKQIENSILEYLEAKKYYAIKHQRIGLFDTKINKFRMSNNRFHRRGIADIQTFIQTRVASWPTGLPIFATTSLFLEVKTDVGRQSDAQKEFQNNVEKAGCIYKIVRSIDDVEKVIKKIKETNNCNY